MKDYYTLVKKHKPKQVFAVDAVLMPRDAMKQQRDHEIWLFAHHFGNPAMLKAATSTAAELLALSGPMISYHVGPLGVIKEGGDKLISCLSMAIHLKISLLSGKTRNGWTHRCGREASIQCALS